MKEKAFNRVFKCFQPVRMRLLWLCMQWRNKKIEQPSLMQVKIYTGDLQVIRSVSSKQDFCKILKEGSEPVLLTNGIGSRCFYIIQIQKRGLDFLNVIQKKNHCAPIEIINPVIAIEQKDGSEKHLLNATCRTCEKILAEGKTVHAKAWCVIVCWFVWSYASDIFEKHETIKMLLLNTFPCIVVGALIFAVIDVFLYLLFFYIPIKYSNFLKGKL